jgi:hypothetical protein
MENCVLLKNLTILFLYVYQAGYKKEVVGGSDSPNYPSTHHQRLVPHPNIPWVAHPNMGSPTYLHYAVG